MALSKVLAQEAKLRLEGKTTRQIGVAVGKSHVQVWSDLKREDVRAVIEKAANKIVQEGMQDAVDTLLRCVSLGTYTRDKDLLKIALDASKHVTGLAGISGNTPSMIINAMIQINSGEIPPIIADLLAQIANRDCHAIGDEAVDVESVDVTPKEEPW